MTNFIRAFIRDERGQDCIECSILVGFVAIVGILVFSGSGGSLKGMWALRHEQVVAANAAVD